MTADLNAAAPSFYSVYQLLPFSNADIEFHSIEGQPSVTNEWGGELSKRPNFYTEILPARLAVAREFRDHMLRHKPIPNAVCFYSDRIKTPLTLKVRQHGNGPCTVEIDRKAAGDGSVVAEMIPFESRPVHAHTEIRRLRAAHMYLPNAGPFRSYINELRTRVQIESIVRADPEIEALETPLTKQTLAINRRILRRGLGDQSDAELAADLYQMAVRARNLSETASQLYALTLAFDPKGPKAPFAANNLAHNLLENDLWRAARGYLEHAQQHIRLVPRDQSRFLITLHTNTGVAYEKTGDYCMALKAYTLAGKKGNRNRKNLMNALSRGELAQCHSSVNTSLSTRANAFAGGRPIR